MVYRAKKITTDLGAATNSTWGQTSSSTESDMYLAYFDTTAGFQKLYKKVGYAGTTSYYKEIKPNDKDTMITSDSKTYYISVRTNPTTTATEI